MQYNSQKDILIIPEYGRNIQNMILYAKEIEDKEYRQAVVETIVSLMHQMHPQNRSIEDYRAKLWKHVFHIANYDIDVSPPEGVITTLEEAMKKPDPVDYPSNNKRFRHYGSHVQKLISKAVEMEDGPKKDGFIRIIAAFMKQAYISWNMEHYVNDEVIKGDLAALSDGALIMDENTPIPGGKGHSQHQQKRRKKHSGNSTYYKSNGRKSGGKKILPQ